MRINRNSRTGILLFTFHLFFISGYGALQTEPSASNNTPPMRALSLVNSDRVLVIAHRGYSGLAPENTLPAFELAFQTGSDLVELDYYHSKDQLPIVFHDTTLDRTTNARDLWPQTKIPVRDRTWDDLRQLDAGTWFHPRYAGVRIPTLSEALDFIQPHSVTLIERKEGDAETCIRLLEEKNLLHDVVVQAFDWTYLRQCRELAPDLVLGALGPPGSWQGRRLEPDERWLNSPFLEAIAETDAQIVVWNHQVTQQSIREAQQRGFRVWIYTINDPVAAANLVRIGVDGIITDHPGRIWKQLAIDR
jgi:glycerophosphoryl diester phosphodiesterase